MGKSISKKYYKEENSNQAIQNNFFRKQLDNNHEILQPFHSTNMDFLKDPRFSQYRTSTTMTKYFPLTMLNESQVQQNVIYQLLKINQPTKEQKHTFFVEKQRSKEKQRRSTIEITDKKFLANKSSQRLKTINSYFEIKKIVAQQNLTKKTWKKGRTQGLRKQIIKLSQFSTGVQKFQKSIKNDKKRINLLKNYNEIVENHFQRFKVNEDRTRKQIKDHEQIIRLLLTDDTDENQAYFNVIQNKKPKNKSNNESRKTSVNNSQPVKKNDSFCLITDQKINEYISPSHCQQKISRVLEAYKKTNLKRPISKKAFQGKKNKNTSFAQFKQGKQNESRFFKQYNQKSSSNKQNAISLYTPSTNQGTIKIKKIHINRKKEDLLFGQHSEKQPENYNPNDNQMWQRVQKHSGTKVTLASSQQSDKKFKRFTRPTDDNRIRTSDIEFGRRSLYQLQRPTISSFY